MRQVVVETKQISRQIISCDFCPSESGKIKACAACKKDCCQSCGTYWDSDIDGDDYGDYPEFYCARCTKIAEPFKSAVAELREEFEKKSEFFRGEWLKLCRQK